ncbi:MAG: monovalent cation/H(+) antiporter subunit G [Acidimicrobiales bacterium]|nr:monovalent cation/H(+) antiporter subunit G [Acidimicrobiales bacterium]MCB9392095.1 monovalent cation/H(+) antiporter subunit G [Acidimicrobiaceae bacterium]
MSAVFDVVSAVLFVAGAALAIVAALGLHRFGDTRSRMHAATKPATLGVLCCAAGAALQMESGSLAAKLAVAVVLQFVTAPVGAHLLARSITSADEPRPPTTS